MSNLKAVKQKGPNTRAGGGGRAVPLLLQPIYFLNPHTSH